MKANIFEIYVKVYVGSRNRTLLPSGLVGKESACSAGDPDSVPGSGRCSGGENGNLLQYSCLENSMDRGAWRATVHGVTESRTPLYNLLSLFTYLRTSSMLCVSTRTPVPSPTSNHYLNFWVFPYSFIILICIPEHRSLALYRNICVFNEFFHL